MKDRTKKFFSWAGVVILALLIIGVFIGFGPPQLLEKTSQPKFCITCHIMKPEYEAWRASCHREIGCVDCHLPNNNFIAHYLEKIMVGIRDPAMFYGGFTPENIEATGRSRKIIKANCVKCHSSTVSKINTADRECWSCHRTVIHKIQISACKFAP
jgi:cytochrome c nitrite reductase small subunit